MLRILGGFIVNEIVQSILITVGENRIRLLLHHSINLRTQTRTRRRITIQAVSMNEFCIRLAVNAQTVRVFSFSFFDL